MQNWLITIISERRKITVCLNEMLEKSNINRRKNIIGAKCCALLHYDLAPAPASQDAPDPALHISVFHNLIRKIFKLIFFLMLTFNWHLLPENQTNRNFFFIKNVQNVKKSFTSYTVAYITKAWIYWAVEPETPVSCGAWDTCFLRPQPKRTYSAPQHWIENYKKHVLDYLLYKKVHFPFKIIDFS